MSRKTQKTQKIRMEWMTYLRLLCYARPYIWRLVIGAFCGILFAGSTVSILPILKLSFAHIFNYEDMDLQRVILLGCFIPILVFIRGIGAYANSYLIQWVGNRVVMDLRIETFTHLQNLSIAYFDRNKTGEMISRTVNDSTLLERAVSTVLTDMIRQPFVLVGCLVYLFILDWKLALASLVIFPVCLIPILLFGRKVRRVARQGQERLADIVSIMQEAIGGVRIVKAFSMEGRERRRFAEQCRNFFGRIMRVVRAKASIEPIIVFIASLGVVLALVYAAVSRMPLQDFIAFVMALVLVYEPAKKLSKLHLGIQHSSAAADRIFEILDTESAVCERTGAIEFSEDVRQIEFKGVTFAYDETPVLRDLSFRVRAGERVAIVGSSGAGKTTVVNLLLRFFDVTEGCIRFNDRDIRDLTIRSLRRQFGLVTQETFLFNDTVANNISYGLPGAEAERIEEAARRAHAHEFITQLQDGYATVIGERGDRLSGGQRQRLAIARAIIANPPVLILDEATSALDTESERLVQEAIDELMEGRTVLAIAHRLSTIMHCDRILVMNAGTITEEGTHKELLERGGIYRRLYDLQFRNDLMDRDKSADSGNGGEE